MSNILILTPFFRPNIGGAESFTEALCKEIIKAKHQLTVLTFKPFKGNSPSYESNGLLQIYRMRWLVKQSHAWRGVTLKNALSVIPQMGFRSIFLCAKNKYDIIHAQGLLSGFVAVLLKRIFKVKVYITLLALYGYDKMKPGTKAICKFILDNCDLIFVEGDNGAKDVNTLADGQKLRIFNHWCDQAVFYPPEKRQSYKTRILFIGRPIPEKGKHIIEGAERILNDPQRYEFRYIENIKYEELPEIYRWADICCVVSLYPEGYSRVCIESASSGCGLIVSNRGSLPEMCSSFAMVIHPDPDDLAEYILEMSSDIDFWKEQSLKYARENFSPRNAEVFLKEYANDI